MRHSAEVAGLGIGEGVHCSTIGVELPVDLGAAHLLFEGRDLGRRHERIGRAVADEQLGLDVGRVGGSRTCKNAMVVTTAASGAPLRASSSAVPPPKQ